MFTSYALVALCAVLSLPVNVAAAAAPTQMHEFSERAAYNKTYTLSKNIVGHKFYDNFHFFDRKDPTDGLVKYLSLKDARKWNLTSATKSVFTISGDSTETLAVGQGRKSTRIESKWSIGNHVHILDLAQMPTGRGSWPAYWMVGPNWPNGGEIDIIEGANDILPNLMTIHTTPNCTMQGISTRVQSGRIKAQDCNAFANGNVGCGVYGSKGNDFGPKLNSGNGGYFAFQRTDDEVNVWFFKRYTQGIPADILDPRRTSVNPATWGAPDAHWSSSNSCDLKAKLAKMKIVMNLTFCGGFGGHTFPLPGGTPGCEDFVRNNPQEFKDAMWKVYGLRIYE
ncbi:glycoside hydrolase family 16 protein [Auriculariales sp. MPI-PUGE-AT-0066]|nr:glycoside hydrolase family 16 protein [Auriculariales sp. MPI-PUGE-AT-0066]